MRVERNQMQPKAEIESTVLVLAARADDAQAICLIVANGPYRAKACSSLTDLETVLSSDPCLAVILDFDSIPLDNRTIRNLTLAFPSIHFLGASEARFHPDLKDAIAYHLFACLNKPIDPDELHYFLKCILDEGVESRGPPDGA